MDENMVDCGCDNVLFLNITKSYGTLMNRKRNGLPPVKGRENIYECTRKYWVLSKAHADKADYIVGVVKNELGIYVIKIVYEFADGERWRKVQCCPELSDDEELRENRKYFRRFAFSGKEASSDVQQRYVDREIDFKFGTNPVKYNF